MCNMLLYLWVYKLKLTTMENEKIDGQTIGFLFACALIVIGFIAFIICEGSIIG